MRRILIFVMIASLLAACGGSESSTDADNRQKTSAAATAKAGQDGGDKPTPAPSRTPDNAVATADASGSNTEFATAIALSNDPIKATVKESTFYYKAEVPKGGVISSTLTVDAGSPAPVKLVMYDANQSYLEEINIPVGERGHLGRIFSDEQGGTIFFSVRGNSSFEISALVGNQNDADSNKDAGGDFPKALAIKPGTINGRVGYQDTDDYYSFELPKTGQIYKLTIMPGESTINLSAYDDDKSYQNEINIDTTEKQSFEQVVQAERGGRWYVRVRGEGPYSFTLAAVGQDDAASGKDAGDDFPKALKVEPEQELSGLLGDSDLDDYFGINVPKTGGTFSVTLSALGDEADLNVSVYNEEKNYINEATTTAGGDPGLVSEVLSADDGGRWYVRVRGKGRYSFVVNWLAQDDGSSKKDAGNDFEKAVTVDAASFTGTIGGRDDDDYFKIKGSHGGTITISAVGEGTINISIYGLDKNYLLEESVSVNGDPVEIKPEFGEPGKDYYVRIRGDKSNYTINIAA